MAAEERWNLDQITRKTLDSQQIGGGITESICFGTKKKSSQGLSNSTSVAFESIF